MTSLANAIGDNKKLLIADLAALVDSTVSSLSGLSGMAVKGALTAARGVDKNIVSKAITRAYPGAVDELSPLWDEYKAGGAGSFGAHMEANKTQSVDALMKVGDDAVEGVGNATLSKLYKGIRAKGEKILSDNLKNVGDVIERHAS